MTPESFSPSDPSASTSISRYFITHSKFHKATIVPPPLSRPATLHRPANMPSTSGALSVLNTKVYAF